MNASLKDLARKALRKFNVGITTYTNLQLLNGLSSGVGSEIELLLKLKLTDEDPSRLPGIMRNSKSQFRQDLFVAGELGCKRDGYFVEFGATNGVNISNTYLLEKEFGWNGILAEPAKRWHEELRKNRNSHIETDCVWSNTSSVLSFNEADSGELSTIASFSSSDNYREERRHGTSYSVKTISLEDLLDKYSAPKEIDYLSIDTEGSEYEILRNFNFDKYRIKVITCEHNFTSAREKIFSLLKRNGYIRKFPEFSRVDDWYVRAD